MIETEDIEVADVRMNLGPKVLDHNPDSSSGPITVTVSEHRIDSMADIDKKSKESDNNLNQSENDLFAVKNLESKVVSESINDEAKENYPDTVRRASTLTTKVPIGRDSIISITYRTSQNAPIPNLVAFQVQCGSSPPVLLGLSYAPILHSIISEKEFNARIEQISDAAKIGFKSTTIIWIVSLLLAISFATTIVTYIFGLFLIPVVSIILILLIVYLTLLRAKQSNQKMEEELKKLFTQFNDKDKEQLKWQYKSLIATRRSKVKTLNVSIHVLN